MFPAFFSPAADTPDKFRSVTSPVFVFYISQELTTRFRVPAMRVGGGGGDGCKKDFKNESQGRNNKKQMD